MGSLRNIGQRVSGLASTALATGLNRSSIDIPPPTTALLLSLSDSSANTSAHDQEEEDVRRFESIPIDVLAPVIRFAL